MRSLRLHIIQNGEEARLQSLRRVERRPPPQLAQVPDKGGRGTWLELRDPSGKVLYTRVFASARFSPSVEIATGDEKGPFSRRDSDHPRSHHLLVPEPPQGSGLQIIQREGGRERALFKHSFDKLSTEGDR